MKRSFLLLLFLFGCTVLLSAAEPYEVRAASGLNVRSGPGLLAPVIGSLPNRDTVRVQEITDGWAQIEYPDGAGWVSAQFLLPADTEAVETVDRSAFPADKKAVLLAVLILSGVLWILYAVRKRWEERVPAGLLWSGCVLFWLLCSLEIHHVIGLSGGLWFCTPDVVGWGMAILNVLLMGFVFFNQFRVFAMLLGDLQIHTRQKIDYRPGIYSYPVAILAIIAAGCFFPDAMGWIVGLFLIAQLVQVVIIVVKARHSPLSCLASLITYLVGSVATLLVMVHFLVVAVVIAVVWVILRFMGSVAHATLSRPTYIYY